MLIVGKDLERPLLKCRPAGNDYGVHCSFAKRLQQCRTLSTENDSTIDWTMLELTKIGK